MIDYLYLLAKTVFIISSGAIAMVLALLLTAFALDVIGVIP